jgi:hypothetical protein
MNECECGAKVEQYWEGKTDVLGTCLNAMLSTTNPTWTDLELNPRHCGERPVANAWALEQSALCPRTGTDSGSKTFLIDEIYEPISPLKSKLCLWIPTVWYKLIFQITSNL